ncbi:hypothetical protein N9W70_04980, partial [Schleiferiaceae bacterium]|nr:hypothetical protein [Schleiferiaceae bacterium]
IKEKPINGNRIVWRYLSLEKFLDLLLNSEIFFTNLTKLTDKYEGTIFQSNLRMANSAIKDNPSYKKKKAEITREHNRVNNLRNYTLVNCWTLKKHESFALWKIYVGTNPGVAIRTTVSKLRQSINKMDQEFDENISMAKVKYQDRLDESFSRIEATITKKKFYDFESEMRLMVFNSPPNEDEAPYDIEVGRKFNINPKILLNELYISPFISEPYRKTIINTVTKLAPFLEERIKESEINDS